MKLKSLTQDALVILAKKLAQQEREIQIELLEAIREIEDRRIHLEMGYDSLHTFMVKELEYSDGSAGRLISAMRLTRAVPEVKEHLKDGSLNLSTASMVQSFFRAEKKYSAEEKKEIVQSIENKTIRETEVILSGLAPEFARKEKERVINSQEIEIRFVADQELQELMQRLKDLKGLKNYADLFKHAIREVLKKADPIEKELRSGVDLDDDPEKVPTSRYVSQSKRVIVWKRAGRQCTYTDPKTLRRCTARHHLQIEHLLPYALGGSHSLENLTLRCRAHNLLAARRVFGEKWKSSAAELLDCPEI